MATARRIELSAEEMKTLRMWMRAGTTEQRLARRARVILSLAEGLPIREVGERCGMSEISVFKWKKRFLEMRLDGLPDEKRRGRPATITAEERLRVIALATGTPEKGKTSWSVRDLAEASGLSATTVHRILSEGKLKPHKVEYWCGRSPDPEFEEKQAAILGLYLDPPENALVLSVDEKSQIQALDRTQPELPMRSGEARRLTATYRRHGTTCLLAALSLHSGEVTGRCRDTNDHTTFLCFLKALYRKYPRKHLYVICDNLSVHKHKGVKEWAAKRRRLTILFNPTYASWLNQVEIFFNIFTREVMRGGVWASKRDLVDQIMDYIKNYNEEATPFSWNYTGKPLTV
jgi:putative transposase